jgi:hypothetical protein
MFIHLEIGFMLEKSFGLLFYLKKPKGYKKGPVPIYVRITVDGDEKEMSTKRSWELSRWGVKANRASGTKEDARALNDYLNVAEQSGGCLKMTFKYPKNEI